MTKNGAFINNVSIAGILIDHTLEETTYTNSTTGDEVECIRGEMILRTADESEHSVKFFANKYKKDKDCNFTSDENKIYKSLMTVISDYKTLKEFPDDADFVEINSASFGINDYISKNTGEVVSTNPISSNFINRISKESFEAASPSAKFEVEGIIAEIKDELVKNEPTGNLNVIMNVITQTQTGRGKESSYEIKDMFPLKLWVDKSMADDFRAAYAEGMFTKLAGVIINRTEITTVIEKQSFGKDLNKTFMNTIRRNEIESGSECTDLYSIGLTDDTCAALISRRKAKLAEIKNGKKSTSASGVATRAEKSMTNPFASKNPFAK